MAVLRIHDDDEDEPLARLKLMVGMLRTSLWMLEPPIVDYLTSMVYTPSANESVRKTVALQLSTRTPGSAEAVCTWQGAGASLWPSR